MLEASTNSYVSDFVQCEDLGLEIAMKQLMEATHDALVNMKGEILRMQYDLERAVVEISLLQQREELFQQSEQRMLGKLESLLDEMRDIQRNSGKGEKIDSLRDKRFILQFSEEPEEKCAESGRSSITEILKAKVGDVQQRSQQRAALTEEMLQRISPKRIEQSVAVVRGWLQSPTPSEASSAPTADQRGKAGNARQQRLCQVPMPNLVSSVKEEARLSATHRRAFTPTQTKVPEHSIECGETRVDFPHPADSTIEVVSERCLNSATPESGRPLSQPAMKKAQYKENATQDCQPLTKSFALAAIPHPKKEVAISCKEHPVMQEGRPVLRILKPKNFKISDLLISDSEEELGSK